MTGDTDSHSDVDLFEGLELVDPGGVVKERVLTSAALELASRRRTRRRKWLAGAGLAAGAILAVVLSLGSPELGWGPVRPGGRGVATPPRRENPAVPPVSGVRTALDELRSDLEEIDEMTELIDPKRKEEKQAILRRVQACLADLANLESLVHNVGESSPASTAQYKEDRA